MDVTLHKGDRVLVNLAPFIASPRRNREAVPCDVLEVDTVRVHVSTRSPYRKVELWVEECWIEDLRDTNHRAKNVVGYVLGRWVSHPYRE